LISLSRKSRQLPANPLSAVDGTQGLKERLPEVAAKLGKDLMWTNEAEEVFNEKMWEKPE
jgi:hypothetical protein